MGTSATPDYPTCVLAALDGRSGIDPPLLPMLIIHVQVHVRAESINAFVAATRANAAASAREPGVVRFDVVQQDDDPTRFVLVEAYRTPDAQAAHKETAHYKTWRDAVEPMMAEPRRSTKYRAIAPEANAWEYPR